MLRNVRQGSCSGRQLQRALHLLHYRRMRSNVSLSCEEKIKRARARARACVCVCVCVCVCADPVAAHQWEADLEQKTEAACAAFASIPEAGKSRTAIH